MAKLTELLAQLRSSGIFCAMVYLQEAHADDLWPLGLGIKKHTSLAGRIAACSDFLSRHQSLRDALDVVAVDSMDDSFLHTYAAWPERYYVVGRAGKILWSSILGGEGSKALPAFEQIMKQVQDPAGHRHL